MLTADEAITIDGLRALFRSVGEDPEREGLSQTPGRFLRAFQEMCSGYNTNLELSTFTNYEGLDEIILSKNIDFYSLCEHHLLPFYGVAHVAYIPNEKIIGLSKLSRIVDMYSKRLQIQERLCHQIAYFVYEQLRPAGSACIIEAKHMCMACRGVKKQNSTMVTSSLEGVFMERAAKQELMQLIRS